MKRRLIPIIFILLILMLYPSDGLAQEADSVKKKSSFALFPAFSYAPETSVQLGAAAVWVLNNTDRSTGFVRESTISPFFLYTFKNQVISAVNLNYFTKDGSNLNGSFRVFNFPDFYFGLGNDNDPDVKESYTNFFVQLEGQYLKMLNTKTFVGLGVDIHSTSIKEVVQNGMLETDQVTGMDGGFLFGLGPVYRFDSRDNTIYPTKGYFVTLRSLLTHLGDFSYTSHTIDLRRYWQLGNEDNILAMQVRSSLSTGNDIPFYKLPQLAGDERLRGIANASLYRDRQLLYSQVEYRRPLFWRFGMTVFAGIGDVAYNLGDFNLSEFKYVAGLGGRFAAIPEKKLNIRADLGVARGGQMAIYIGLSEAF